MENKASNINCTICRIMSYLVLLHRDVCWLWWLQCWHIITVQLRVSIWITAVLFILRLHDNEYIRLSQNLSDFIFLIFFFREKSSFQINVVSAVILCRKCKLYYADKFSMDPFWSAKRDKFIKCKPTIALDVRTMLFQSRFSVWCRFNIHTTSFERHVQSGKT